MYTTNCELRDDLPLTGMEPLAAYSNKSWLQRVPTRGRRGGGRSVVENAAPLFDEQLKAVRVCVTTRNFCLLIFDCQAVVPLFTNGNGRGIFVCTQEPSL